MPPTILLAFANDKDRQFLRRIAEEQRTIKQALDPLAQGKLVQVEILSNATAEDIFTAFRTYGDRIKIFHYGGHANDLDLMLSGAERPLNMQGFSQFLSQQKGLELVFMNGCATAAQQQPLQEAGIPTLILTETAINDRAAQQFASQFYQGLAAGRNIEQAFEEAEGATKASLGTTYRDLFMEGISINEGTGGDLPWRLHQTSQRQFTLPTRAPFPRAKAIIGVALLISLITGGYGLWRFTLPFDLSIPIQFPLEVTDTHFRYDHQLELQLPEGAIRISLEDKGKADFDRVSGKLEPVTLSIQSPLWDLTQDQLLIERNPQALQLVWKEELLRIKGKVIDQDTQAPIANAIITLGDIDTRSDQSGDFDLLVPDNRVADVSHRINLNHPDYSTRNWTINLADGQGSYEIPLISK